MAKQSKKGGAGRLAVVFVLGAVGAGGYKYYESKKESGLVLNAVAAAACLGTLAQCSTGTCPWQPSDCPVDEACRILRARGAGDEAVDLAHDMLLEVCVSAAPL
ncbi:MAG: hypothetical protein ACOYOB_19375, partial [Myxococcota bacterium]